MGLGFTFGSIVSNCWGFLIIVTRPKFLAKYGCRAYDKVEGLGGTYIHVHIDIDIDMCVYACMFICIYIYVCVFIYLDITPHR